MSLSDSIGGYFGLENKTAPIYHEGVCLNTARNALRYIIRAYSIKKLFVPYYTCPVVWQAVNAENCKIIPYDIDVDFMPMAEFDFDTFVLYNNYFGVCGKNVEKLAQKYENLIIDNAQAFFSPSKGKASFYSPRKFFGLPDGGIAVCEKRLKENFATSHSYALCSHLLKRVDLGAEAGYDDFKKNDTALQYKPIEKMSSLTKLLMSYLDYDRVKKARLENFHYLHQRLEKFNELKIDISSDDVPMVYPFKTDDIALRSKLIENKIYVASYWPICQDNDCMSSTCSQKLSDTIIPLPIDQRYDMTDMSVIVNIIIGE